MDEDECVLAEDFDCPSLLCEELEDEETKDEQGSLNRRRRRRSEGEVELLKQREDEGEGNDAEQTEKGVEEEKRKKTAQEKDSAATEGKEEKQVKLDAKLGAEEEEEEEEEARQTQVENKPEKGRRAEKDESRKRKEVGERDERRKGRKRRGKKHGEKVRNRRSSKDGGERFEEKRAGQTQEASSALSPEEASALSEPPSIELTDSCDLSDPIYIGCGGAGLYGPTVPVPLLYSSQPLVPIQPAPPPSPPLPPPPAPPAAPPQPHGTKRPHSPVLPCGLSQSGPQPLEMEITQVYSTRRSIRYSTRGQDQAVSFSLLPGLETVDSCLLPPAPKKKTRTLYSTDQLEHLEALFQEDHYPDAEKRKVIATSVGVTPQRIMVWFQNRRAKWRKAERSLTAKVEAKQSRTRCISSSPHQKINPSQSNSKGAPSFPGHFASKLPPLTSAAPPFASLSSQTLPSYSNLLASLNSPGQSRLRDGAQHQLPSQGGMAECHPRPMYSPPPLRRASLPLFPAASNPAPPLLNALAHTPPLFLDAVEGGGSLPLRDGVQPLQTDTSSLFDYLTSSQQNNNPPYQLQTSYPTNQHQHQHQPQTSLPRMAYLTPSPYLTPNAPDSNPTSYLTLCPGGNSSGMVTYSAGGHTYFQSQSTGQILLQSAAHHGGIPAYQSYPWGNVYGQTGIHQHVQCPPIFPPNLGGAREHQPSSSASLSSYFTLGEHGPSHANPQRSSHTLTHTTSVSSGGGGGCSSTATVLPPVSTLRPSRLRADITPTKAASLLPSQVTPASPDSPTVTPCVKIEYDSPQEIHSHFHCDFSSIHF